MGVWYQFCEPGPFWNEGSSDHVHAGLCRGEGFFRTRHLDIADLPDALQRTQIHDTQGPLH